MYSYYTELDIERCKKLLNEKVKQYRFQIGTIRGKVDFKKDKFYLIKRNLIYHNAFSRTFHGEFIKREDGTIIQGSFSMHAFVKMFMIIWFGGVMSIGTFMFFISFSDVFLGTSYGEGSAILGLVIPFIIFIFGVLLVKLGLQLSENQEEYVLEFIKKTLDVKEIETQI